MASLTNGSSQCPKCWAVWGWITDDANLPNSDICGCCPRCGQTIPTLPSWFTYLTRLADLAGFPSAL